MEIVGKKISKYGGTPLSKIMGAGEFPDSSGDYCLKLERHFPLREAAAIFLQMRDGINHMHENNVAHDDLHLNNILLLPNGVVKIIDFGTAKKFDAKSKLSATKDDLHFLRAFHNAMLKTYNPKNGPERAAEYDKNKSDAANEKDYRENYEILRTYFDDKISKLERISNLEKLAKSSGWESVDSIGDSQNDKIFHF